jgi:hypothetical protein
MEEFLGSVKFPYCPACLSPVLADDTDQKCHLCKSVAGIHDGRGGRLKMREELAFQIRESRELQDVRRKDLGAHRYTTDVGTTRAR